MKSLTPVSITTSFRKAGLFLLNRTTVATEKLMPCEAFKDERPFQKVQALRGGKDAVLQYLQQTVAHTIPLRALFHVSGSVSVSALRMRIKNGTS